MSSALVRRRVAALLVVALGVAGCADESARPVLGPPVETTQTVSGDDGVTVATVVPTVPDPTDGLVPLAGFDTAVLRVINGDEVTQWPVLYAASIDARRRGLMEVTDLGEFVGMVFVFDGDTEAAFWMRNTPLPLSIVFVRADGTIVSTTDMEPCGDVDTCPSYPPSGPYRFAVEVPQGGLPNLGIGPNTLLGLS